jgi:hypothetical protein
MKYFPASGALGPQEPNFSGSRNKWRKPMTKLTIMAAALVAAAAYASEASAARSNPASRHAQPATATESAAACVRAPNVGAFASDPYTSPPCMPGKSN